MSFYSDPFGEYLEHDHLATMSESVMEWAANCGGDTCRIDRAWLLHDFDVWVANPHYTGPAQPHPECEDIEAPEEECCDPAAPAPADAIDSSDLPF
jgi:hypothetical protein